MQVQWCAGAMVTVVRSGARARVVRVVRVVTTGMRYAVKVETTLNL